MLDAQLVVLAKSPVAGRVKTRLCPPLTHDQAAEAAAAALADTLAAVAQVPVHRRVLILEGDPSSIDAVGFEVLPQRGDGLDQRLAAAMSDTFADCSSPVLLIGMDTPQVTAVLLAECLQSLLSEHPVLGLADDGGWWAIGLHAPDPHVFLGVPMSAPDTGMSQHRRMGERGLTPVMLPGLRDIDEHDDLLAVAAGAPSSRVAAFVRNLDARPTTEAVRTQ